MTYPQWLIFAIVFSVMGSLAIPAYLGMKAKKTEVDDLLDKGQLGEAEILGYEEDEYLYVRYRFAPNESKNTIECRKILMRGVERYQPGTTVPVRYLAKYPSISVLVPYSHDQMPS